MGIDAIPKRTGAGLFGVVLLCALPSLLSLPAPAVPYATSRFSFNPGAAQAAQTESLLDWTGMDMDLDGDSGSRRKVNLPLSFLNGQPGASDILQGFASHTDAGFALSPTPEHSSTEAEFDVSLVPSATEGKIRVRIESPSEPGLMSGGSSPPSSLGSPALGFTQNSPSEGWDLDFATAPEHSQGIMWDAPPAGANVDVSLFAPQPSSVSASGRRRVRIALKSGPVAGAEGGEWEVEVR
ncbi:hypothetical protein JB92DRAFT_914397 [Gautieria morchelliformis]|nr:hypothetical protein JB92DRAFT_914397 [Gautieria morchelliformis]